MNFLTEEQTTLDLNKLRDVLVRLEDTIIFDLIERAQFARNEVIYQVDAEEFQALPAKNQSFFDYFLHEVEKMHATVRRYKSPDEYPFTSPLPEPILPPIDFPKVLHPNDINVNAEIRRLYLENIVPAICPPGNDKNYGSAALGDVECLQALSRRIHYGKFIAESKFRNSTQQYVELIRREDRAAIEELLTNREVEAKLLERLRLKALNYGQSPEEEQKGESKHLKIPVEVVVRLYEQWVIPLTKKVEVEYLMQRLKGTEWETGQ
ncbi:uncharacterized protein VTP21DRAFT_1216 [Calcarisporiella thermophila]|uniref:uncharacterized protein n=1 Tax=Calcarisporiella thermophila TaxID=911321 RepID=UPI003742B849